MNIIKNIDQFNINNIFFCDPIKNNIMVESNFIRILYSTDLFVMNGIYLSLSFQNMYIEKYYNKYKCSFDTNVHKVLIDKLKKIEESIIALLPIKDKTPDYKLYNQIKNGNIRIFSEDNEKINNMFLLKISGIWETDTTYGITYKFINIKTA